MFTDHVRIKCIAGKGGNGVIAWRREKFIPKGGPYGGNGGPGGSIILRCDQRLHSLDCYRNRPITTAKNGQQGGSQRRQGKAGQNLILTVPCGTLVKDAVTETLIYDFTEHGEELCLCRGGKGGKGNAFFKTAVNQAPARCTPGLLGETQSIDLELKLIADVGLLGLPNAGKSTLLSALASIQVKTAAYPFTTLTPNLSCLEFDDFSRLSIADIPGIIQGAHLNRGLGISFLKHIERAATLIYVIDLSGLEGRSPYDDFLTLRHEITAYSTTLAKKPFLVALNKIDTENADKHCSFFKKRYPFPPDTLLEVSALTGEGLDQFIAKMRILAQKDGIHYGKRYIGENLSEQS
ncbi:MAG: GTPase ObgE [Chlamydiota bacterium]